MQVACLVIEHFAYQLHLLSEPRLRGQAVVVADHAAGVMDASPDAARQGISVGMPLRRAVAQIRDAVLIEPDPALYQREWGRILDALREQSPVVEDDERGLAWIGVDGLKRLYGTEANLVRALRSAVPATIEARLGLARGRFPAYAAAWHAMPNRAFRAPDDLRAFLAPKTIDLLPVPWQVRDRLYGFGLTTLGQLAAQRAGPLQAQFGPVGRLIWELARGIDTRPLIASAPQTLIEESLTFPAPTAHVEPVLFGVRSLLERAYRRPELRGRFARAAVIRGDVLNMRPWYQRVTFRDALGSADAAFQAVRYALDNISLPGALEDLSLTLTGITGEAGAQLNLYTDVRKRENLSEAIRQVQEQTGGVVPVYTIQEMEPWSRHPERRHALVAFAL